MKKCDDFRMLESLRTQKRIVSCLIFLQKASIYQLMQETNKARITLWNNLQRLKKKGIEFDNRKYYIETESLYTGKRGRPLTIFKLRGV